MNKMLRIALLSLLAGTAIARADCKDDLNKAQERARKLEVSDDFRQQLRQLHKSALLLVQNGKEDLCDDVADAMENMVDKRKKVLDKHARAQALRNAPPITDLNQVIELNTLVDSTVYDRKGDELGTLRAVAMDARQGKVAYVLLEYGGFLGFGEKLIPIPFDKLHMTKERGALVLDMDRALLDDAKGVDASHLPLHPPMPGQTAAAAEK